VTPSPKSTAPPHFLASDDVLGKPLDGWRLKVYTVIFEADTVAGRRFDVLLILAILVSVGVVMADSVQSLSRSHRSLFSGLEWFFTVFFTLEYVARLVCVRRPLRYATSFFWRDRFAGCVADVSGAVCAGVVRAD
jgi:voltage-gated potassium channel